MSYALTHVDTLRLRRAQLDRTLDALLREAAGVKRERDDVDAEIRHRESLDAVTGGWMNAPKPGPLPVGNTGER